MQRSKYLRKMNSKSIQVHGYRSSNNGIHRRSPTAPLNGSSSHFPEQHLSLPVPQMHMSEHEIRHEQLLKQGI